MRIYSPHFSCLYDEQEPIGNIGRGSHYSVFRTAEWRNVVREPLEHAQIHDFAVIWDEDHDERVIDVAERIYMAGLFSPIQFIGERKGSLSVIIAARFRFHPPEPVFLKWQKDIERIAGDINGDTWNVNFGRFDKRLFHRAPHQTESASIVQDTEDRSVAYLRHIDNLWNLGTWDYKSKRYPAPPEPFPPFQNGMPGMPSVPTPTFFPQPPIVKR